MPVFLSRFPPSINISLCFRVRPSVSLIKLFSASVCITSHLSFLFQPPLWPLRQREQRVVRPACRHQQHCLGVSVCVCVCVSVCVCVCRWVGVCVGVCVCLLCVILAQCPGLPPVVKCTLFLLSSLDGCPERPSHARMQTHRNIFRYPDVHTDVRYL